ncbi:MAG: alpha/beta fold hydrolase [Alcaligenaceae bacterium]|nr:alpha/beta fold hydrolase [Alcaligenaceae bacterium SAGV5]MPS54114.1 alpha/beta fold hydrolase [Alcaligenaceae bacterium SAGV3]MPT58813.1 alpha/beta fold hydrolase [Alcaligenaceae bacterium]
METPSAPEAPPPEIGSSLPTCGFRTNYHDAGNGPGVLLIHGSGPGVTAWANWRLTIPVLARQARVIAPDMVGFGYTESPPGVRYHWSTWVDQLTALLDALKLERVSVVGNSFGGALALKLAARHPGRVDRLVLMGPVGLRFPITDGLEKVWGYQPSAAAMRELLDVFVHDPSLIDDDLAAMRYRASIRDDVQARFGSMFPPPRQRILDDMATDETVLRTIPHETLIIHGRGDKVIPVEASRRLAQTMPRARLAEIDRCGHWVQIEQPAAFTGLVGEFLAPR